MSYIVDGHHRYESALMYAKETGVLGKTDVSASKMMFAIANAYDPALFVFPTHRIVQGGNQINADLMEKRYHLMPISFEDLQAFVTKPRRAPEFGVYWDGRLYQCSPIMRDITI